jgi:hypothetical protein
LIVVFVARFQGNQPSNQKLIDANLNTKSPSLFSIDNAPATSLRGQILTNSGDVKWQSRTATAPATLKIPISIQQGERLVTGDTGHIKVQFDNIVTLTIFPKSDLSFTQTLPANIVISQDQGQAEYSHLGRSTPLSIRSLGLLININTPGDLVVSVSNDGSEVSVRVVAGEARTAYNDSQNISQLVTVSSGQQFTFNDGTREGTLR